MMFVWYLALCLRCFWTSVRSATIALSFSPKGPTFTSRRGWNPVVWRTSINPWEYSLLISSSFTLKTVFTQVFSSWSFFGPLLRFVLAMVRFLFQCLVPFTTRLLHLRCLFLVKSEKSGRPVWSFWRNCCSDLCWRLLLRGNSLLILGGVWKCPKRRRRFFTVFRFPRGKNKSLRFSGLVKHRHKIWLKKIYSYRSLSQNLKNLTTKINTELPFDIDLLCLSNVSAVKNLWYEQRTDNCLQQHCMGWVSDCFHSV